VPQRVQSRAFSHARGHLRVSRVLLVGPRKRETARSLRATRRKMTCWFLRGYLPMKMTGVHLLLGTLRAVVAKLRREGNFTVTPLACGWWFHLSFEHFYVISMIDKGTDHGKLLSIC